MVAIPFLLAGCFSRENKKKLEEAMKELKENTQMFSDHKYIDSRDTLMVMGFGRVNQTMEEGSAFTFQDPARPMLNYSGSFLNGLKSGMWSYMRGLKNITQIKWSEYTIGNYKIRTNLSDRGTVSTVDEHTNKYVLPVKSDSLVIYFYADTLNARVKRMPYEEVIKNKMQEKGYSLSNTANKLLQDTSNFVSVTSMTFTKGSEKILYKTAYVVLKSGYLAFAMQYNPDTQPSAELFFDGVLTNLYLKDERFYYPYIYNVSVTINDSQTDSAVTDSAQ